MVDDSKYDLVYNEHVLRVIKKKHLFSSKI